MSRMNGKKTHIHIYIYIIYITRLRHSHKFQKRIYQKLIGIRVADKKTLALKKLVRTNVFFDSIRNSLSEEWYIFVLQQVCMSIELGCFLKRKRKEKENHAQQVEND